MPLAERVQWRRALPRHVLSNMQAARDTPLPAWKLEELVEPMSLAIAGLIEQGIDDVRSIETHFDRSDEHRNDYATGQ